MHRCWTILHMQDMEFIFNEMIDDSKRFSAVSGREPMPATSSGACVVPAAGMLAPDLRDACLPAGQYCAWSRVL